MSRIHLNVHQTSSPMSSDIGTNGVPPVAQAIKSQSSSSSLSSKMYAEGGEQSIYFPPQAYSKICHIPGSEWINLLASSNNFNFYSRYTTQSDLIRKLHISIPSSSFPGIRSHQCFHSSLNFIRNSRELKPYMPP